MDHRQITDDVIAEFFRPNPVTLTTFPNRQYFDYQGIEGRLLSSSYAPPRGHPQNAPMLAALADIYRQHQADNQVIFEYQTKLYTAHLCL